MEQSPLDLLFFLNCEGGHPGWLLNLLGYGWKWGIARRKAVFDQWSPSLHFSGLRHVFFPECGGNRKNVFSRCLNVSLHYM